MIDARLVHQWPKLAWVAQISDDSPHVVVYHGPCVETNPHWCVEAVWCGDFSEGDFDRTDRVFGTGIRIRGDEVAVVSSASMMDRIWLIRDGDGTHVSNSLPAILGVTDKHFTDRTLDPVMHTVWGSPQRSASGVLSEGDLHVYWQDNLIVSGDQIQVVPKPDSAPPFVSYDDYFGFLTRSIREMGDNLRAPSRTQHVEPLATISSGYDSPAVALLSRYAGCEQAVTISDANSLWRGSDSGAEIAEKLGLTCRSYQRTASSYPNEIAVWASSGKAGLLSWSQFDLPAPVSAIFIGSYCDNIWSRKQLPPGYTERAQSFLSMGEYRLWTGMLQCAISFLGMHHADEINAISRLPEMDPWSVGGSYDRPIPRRMLEEAGIERGTFAHRKKDTSHESPFRWPYSRDASESFQSYLSAHGRRIPRPTIVPTIRGLATVEGLWSRNVAPPLRLPRFTKFWQDLSNTELLFRWANEELARRYKERMQTTVATT